MVGVDKDEDKEVRVKKIVMYKISPNRQLRILVGTRV